MLDAMTPATPQTPTTTPETRRSAYESARLRLARLRVHGGASLRAAFRESTRLAAKTLDVDRVSIWLFVDDRHAIRCYELYERARNEHSEGASIRREDFPRYFAALEQRRIITAEDARAHEATAEMAEEYLVPLDIVSMLDAPIYRGGDVIGVVCHEKIGARRAWTQEDADFASSVADAIALQFEGAARKDAETALHAHEAYVSEVQKMEALGRVCAGVAHDFRNLLTVVMGHAGLIEADPTASPSVRAEIARVRLAAERGVALTRELATFGREDDGPGRPAIVHLHAVVDGFVEVLRGAVGRMHPIVVEHAPGDGRVFISPAQVERVLLNLAINARDAMPDGGTITLRTYERKVTDGTEHPGHYVVLEVADTGIGMDPATRARVFEPYFTTKPAGKGTGLGLSIVYRIVDQAGGFTHVESAPGKGTTMSVYLPRVAG